MAEVVRSTAYRGVIVDAVAQAAFNEKKWVWVEDKEEGYLSAWVAKEDGDQYVVHLSNGLVRRETERGREAFLLSQREKVLHFWKRGTLTALDEFLRQPTSLFLPVRVCVSIGQDSG